MNKEQLLIYKLMLARQEYWYGECLQYIKGIIVSDMYFAKLKPLFDEFGYQETINMMLEIDKMENPIEVNNE